MLGFTRREKAADRCAVHEVLTRHELPLMALDISRLAGVSVGRTYVALDALRRSGQAQRTEGGWDDRLGRGVMKWTAK
jgi:hypothetical protein